MRRIENREVLIEALRELTVNMREALNLNNTNCSTKIGVGFKYTFTQNYNSVEPQFKSRLLHFLMLLGTLGHI